MQQSSATQSLHLSFWGLRKIVACSHSSSQCLLVYTVFGMVSSLHPTSFLMIFTLVTIGLWCQNTELAVSTVYCTRVNSTLETHLQCNCTTHEKTRIFSNTIPFCHHHSSPIERVVCLVSNEAIDSTHLRIVG